MILLLLYLYAFYLGFALSIGVYRQWVKGSLNKLNIALFAPVLATFIAIDVIINWTVLAVTMGMPPPGAHTISDRFAVYHRGGHGWKTAVACFVCDKLLNTVDPSGQHC